MIDRSPQPKLNFNLLIRRHGQFVQNFTVNEPHPALAGHPSNIQEEQKEMMPKTEVNKHPRVLIANDEPMQLEMLKLLFTKMNFSVKTSVNGYEALLEVKECLSDQVFYDLVVLDLNMPIMNGYKACKNIIDIFSSKSTLTGSQLISLNDFSLYNYQIEGLPLQEMSKSKFEVLVKYIKPVIVSVSAQESVDHEDFDMML